MYMPRLSRTGAIVAGYFALSASLGVFQAFLRIRAVDLRVAGVCSLFALAIPLFTWCKADCAQRAITPPSGATLLVPGVALIGIPYYYFRILPPLKALGHVACAYLVLGLGMATTVLADRTISRVLV
jgi:hypothetical protein